MILRNFLFQILRQLLIGVRLLRSLSLQQELLSDNSFDQGELLYIRADYGHLDIKNKLTVTAYDSYSMSDILTLTDINFIFIGSSDQGTTENLNICIFSISISVNWTSKWFVRTRGTFMEWLSWILHTIINNK